MSMKLGYVSLFSGAGVGCYSFNLEGFDCVATAELIRRRSLIQKYNNVCSLSRGYIEGDIAETAIQQKILDAISRWQHKYERHEVDLVVATPPCQGISVANHKKNNELARNSLVVESLKLISSINPRYFLLENVRGFLRTFCTDSDGVEKFIEEAIFDNLAGKYNIATEILNLKDYGSNSSRTRTLVVGVRKDIEDVTPFDLLPARQEAPSLKELIGHLPRIKTMGQIDSNDVYHYFRPYNPKMFKWVADLKEGQSAFDNKNPKNRPHKVVNGTLIENANKNGDKYRKCIWDKVAPCIHTRNDIISSQSTIHPEDPRVFSIRELMLMMGIPESFKWTEDGIEKVNSLDEEQKRLFLKKHDINIRQCIGEAVPTAVFQSIAKRIRRYEEQEEISINKIKRLIEKRQLVNTDHLLLYLREANLSFAHAGKVAELANAKRLENAAYYTRQDLCFNLVNALPEFKHRKRLRILEPSVGVGNFLPVLFFKYRNIPEVRLDLVDIDDDSIKILKYLLRNMRIPDNFRLRFINDDFLLHEFRKKYDLIVGNPPFGKITSAQMQAYRNNGLCSQINTTNIFALFMERALGLASFVALFTPKSLLNAPEFHPLRKILRSRALLRVNDYGEKGFKGVKIETISLIIDTESSPLETIVDSYILNTCKSYKQNYVTDKYPYWLIYRNPEFDNIASDLQLGAFKVIRDRALTAKHLKQYGKIRVVKSRNISNNCKMQKHTDDSFVDDPQTSPIAAQYFNKRNIVVAPNLSYYPRASLLPKNSIADGSAAILMPKTMNSINKRDLEFFSSATFFIFYRIARNYSTRSLNIDSLSVYFWGLPGKQQKWPKMPSEDRSEYLFREINAFQAGIA